MFVDITDRGMLEPKLGPFIPRPIQMRSCSFELLTLPIFDGNLPWYIGAKIWSLFLMRGWSFELLNLPIFDGD